MEGTSEGGYTEGHVLYLALSKQRHQPTQYELYLLFLESGKEIAKI